MRGRKEARLRTAARKTDGTGSAVAHERSSRAAAEYAVAARLMRMQRLTEQTLHTVQLLKQPQDSQKRHRWMQSYPRQSKWHSRR